MKRGSLVSAIVEAHNYFAEEEILDVLGEPVEDLPAWEVEEDAEWPFEWEDEPVRAYCPRGA